MMNMSNTYNGWENRETWLVNVHFGDDFPNYIEAEFTPDMSIQDVADIYESYVDEAVGEEIRNLTPFLLDFIDLGLINFYELAENVYEDLVDTWKENNPEEEEEEEEDEE